MFPQQGDQGFEDVVQPDDPVRHRGAADAAAVALEDLLQAVQRQAVCVLGDQDIGQQLDTGHALAQRMRRAGSGLDHRFAVCLLEDGLLLPVFDDLRLGRHDVELFLDLGEEGLARAGLFCVAQRQMDLDARQPVGEAFALFARWLARRLVRQLRLDLAERDFQLGLVEKIALKGQLLAARAKAPLPRQAQLLFHQPEQLLLLGDQPVTLGNEVIFLLDQVVFFGNDLEQLRHRGGRNKRRIISRLRRSRHARIIPERDCRVVRKVPRNAAFCAPASDRCRSHRAAS